jgi:hypothetical protein
MVAFSYTYIGAQSALGLCLLASCAISPTTSRAASAVELRANGDVEIGGTRVSCRRDIRTVLDAKLPNLGIATRNLLVLNPTLLARFSPSVRLFVFHHECGHHHVGGDELRADCWAVQTGVTAGWLQGRDLPAICASFGNGKATPTHPAAQHRCRALSACYAAASTARAAPPKTEASSTPPLPRLVHEGFVPAP